MLEALMESIMMVIPPDLLDAEFFLLYHASRVQYIVYQYPLCLYPFKFLYFFKEHSDV